VCFRKWEVRNEKWVDDGWNLEKWSIEWFWKYFIFQMEILMRESSFLVFQDYNPVFFSYFHGNDMSREISWEREV